MKGVCKVEGQKKGGKKQHARKQGKRVLCVWEREKGEGGLLFF